MKNFSKVILLVLLVFICEPFTLKNIKAAELEKNIVLLMDNSKSMKENDKSKLSIIAASMLIDTVNFNNTTLNIIPFGDDTSTLKRLGEKPTSDDLHSQLNEINFSDDFTRLKDGINEALRQLNEVQGDRTIIVLSDGKEEVPGESQEDREKRFNEIVKLAKESKTKINTIGLSKNADKKALSELANLTEGSYFYIENASELFDIYSKILGNLNGYNTIKQFITNASTNEEIKLSSLAQEVIVNIASTDENSPMVSVSFDNSMESEHKLGDKYEIFKIKNSGNNSIKISSSSEKSSLVIIQIKSKVNINVNTPADSFEIPYKVGIDIQLSVDSNEKIKDLHMYKIEQEKKDILYESNGSFKFEFKKDNPGSYPVFITAYDGSGNVIAVKYFNIEVIDNPPFDYEDKSFENKIYSKEDFILNLKQQDNTKVRDVLSKIYIDYEDGSQAESLSSKFQFEKYGRTKIYAQVSGIREDNGEPFFYYLPPLYINVLEKPYIIFKDISYDKPFRENKPLQLKLLIDKSVIYDTETVFIYDSNKNKLGEFRVDKKDKEVLVNISPIEKGKNLKFLLETNNQSHTVINTEINSNLRIVSSFNYFMERYRLTIIIVLILLCLSAGVCGVCYFIYKKYVEGYSFTKIISFTMSSGLPGKLTIALNEQSSIAYLRIVNDTVKVGANSVGSIGYFALKLPEGNVLMQGLMYLFKKENLFRVEYNPIKKQKNLQNSLLSNGELKDINGIVYELEETVIKIRF